MKRSFILVLAVAAAVLTSGCNRNSVVGKWSGQGIPVQSTLTLGQDSKSTPSRNPNLRTVVQSTLTLGKDGKFVDEQSFQTTFVDVQGQTGIVKIDQT